MAIVCARLKEVAKVGTFIPDPLKNVRYAFTPLVTYVSDLPEQQLIATEAPSPGTSAYMVQQLMALHKQVNPWDLNKYQATAKTLGLLGVHHPVWRDWLLSDPALFLVPMLLHICHCFFFNHPLKWYKEALGQNELDAHYKSQHKHVGIRHFQGGVSHVNQMTGREHWEIQHTIVPTIVGALSPGFICSICALIDFIYQAQSPVHTE
ncbi:hypothetical protein BDN67DRAFT_1016709 [Paxillus ammoniavirescens]|nr:hypothetical protein BDN67DRAFT_1016709 [Paxillus ammoniavirescens]